MVHLTWLQVNSRLIIRLYHLTAGELNLLDGDTANDSSITVADSDGILVDDNGTMKKVPASDIKTYASGTAGRFCYTFCRKLFQQGFYYVTDKPFRADLCRSFYNNKSWNLTLQHLITRLERKSCCRKRRYGGSVSKQSY